MSSAEAVQTGVPQAKGPELKKKVQALEDASLYSRRDFFIKAGWYFFWVILTSWVLGLVRYLFPRVLFEPSNGLDVSLPAGAQHLLVEVESIEKPDGS